MKIDNTTVILFIFPVIALCLILITPVLIKPKDTNPGAEPPEFLATIDQLSLFSVAPDKHDDGLQGFKDMFRHEWGEKKQQELDGPPPEQQESPKESPPVVPSLIVNDGGQSFCIIDGEKLGVGDKTARFEIMKIQDNTVSIKYSDGSKETLHVKAY